MTSENKKSLFWDYIDNTPVEEIKRLEELTKVGMDNRIANKGSQEIIRWAKNELKKHQEIPDVVEPWSSKGEAFDVGYRSALRDLIKKYCR